MTDIEIAQAHEMKPITEIAAAAGIDEQHLELYGKYKAKLDLTEIRKLPRKAKLILVTAISPTPAGEENERPSRPRPAVCQSAITAAPDGAPASASSLTRLFVESVCASTCRWERPASGANSSRNFMENALLFKRKSF